MERGSDHGRDSGASGGGRQSAGRTSESRLSGGRESRGRESGRDSAGRDSGRESAGQRRSSRSRGRKRKPRKDGGSAQNGRRTSKQRDAKPPGDGSRGCFFACFGARRSTSPSTTEAPLFTPLPPSPASATGSISMAQSSLTQTASRTNLGSRISQVANDNIYSYSPLTSMHRRNGDSEPDYNKYSSPQKPPSLSESLDQENYKIRQAAPIPPHERTRLNSGPLSIDTIIQSQQDLPPLSGAGHSTTRRRRRSTSEYSNTSTAAAHLLLEHHSTASRSPGGLTCSFSAPIKVGLGQHRLARRVSAADSEDLEGELERPFRSSLTRHSARRSSASGHISTARISRASSAALPDFSLDDTLTLPAIKPSPPQVPAAAQPPQVPAYPAYSPSASPPRAPRLPRSALPPFHTPLALHPLKLPPDAPHPTMIPTMDLGLSSFPKAVPLPQLKLNTTALPAAAWGLLGRQVRGGSCSPSGAAAAMRDSYDDMSSPPASPSGRPARSANSSSAMRRSCLVASRVLQLDRLPSQSLDNGEELNAQDLEEGGDDFGGVPAAIRLTLDCNEPFELHPGPQSPLLSVSKSPFLNSRQESTPSPPASPFGIQEGASMFTSASMYTGTTSGDVQNPARQTSLYKLPSFSLFLPSEAAAEQGQSQLHSEPSSKKPINRSFEQIRENHDNQPETSPKATLAVAAFEGPSYSRPIGLPRVRPLFASATSTTPAVAKAAAAAASVPLPWRSGGGSVSRNHNTEAWTKPGSPPTALGKRVPRSSFTRASRVFPPASSPSPSTSPGPTMKQAQTLTACLRNHTSDTSLPAYTSSRYPATISTKTHSSAPASPTKDRKHESGGGEQLDIQQQPAVATTTNSTAAVRKAEAFSTSSRSLMQATTSSASPARQRQASVPSASPPRKWVRSVTIACAVADPTSSTTPFLDDYGRTSPVHLKTPALLMMMLGKRQGGSSLPASKQGSHRKQTVASAGDISNRHAASQQKQLRSQLDTGVCDASLTPRKQASPASCLHAAPVLSDAAFADQDEGQNHSPGSQRAACSAGAGEDEESLLLSQSPSQQLLPLLLVPWQPTLSSDLFQAHTSMPVSPELQPLLLFNTPLLQRLPQPHTQPLQPLPMHLQDDPDHSEPLMPHLQCACPSNEDPPQNSVITSTQQQQQHNVLLEYTSQLCEDLWNEDGSPPARHNLLQNRSTTTATRMSSSGFYELADTTTLLLDSEYHQLEPNSTALSEHGCRKQPWGSSCSSPCTWGSASAQESFTNQSFTNQPLSPRSVSDHHSPTAASRRSVQRCLDARLSQARASHHTTAPYEYPLEGDLTTTPSPSPVKLSTSHPQFGQAASAVHVSSSTGRVSSACSSPTTSNGTCTQAASPCSQESWGGSHDSATAAPLVAEMMSREDMQQALRSGLVCASVSQLETLHCDGIVQLDQSTANSLTKRHPALAASADSVAEDSDLCTSGRALTSDTERDVYFDAAGTDTAADSDLEAYATAVSSFDTDSDREVGRQEGVRSSCGTIDKGRPLTVRGDCFLQGRWVLTSEEVSAISEPRSHCLET